MKFFGYSKLLLQQLNIEDVGGEPECGGTGLDEGTAKIIEMAYGRDVNFQFRGNCSGGHS